MNRLTIIVTLIFSLAASALGQTIGINLNENEHWRTQAIYADLAKQMLGWGEPDETPWDKELTADSLDPLGWPKVDAAAWSQARGFPNGDYDVTWTGSGTLKCFGKLSLKSGGTAGKAVVTLNHSVNAGDAIVAFTGVAAANPPRGLSIRPQAFKDAGTFHPVFVSMLRPFKAVRYMDLFNINAGKEKVWADRPKPGQFDHVRYGVPYEDGAALGKLLGDGVTLWVCVPRDVDDDYVARMAAIFRDQCRNPIRVEYFNEPWNWSVRRIEPEVYGKRAARVGQIWRETFGAQASRLKVVYNAEIDYLGGFTAAPAGSFDAVALAFYPGLPSNKVSQFSFSADALWALTEEDWARESGRFDKLVAFAKGKGVPVLCYEYGQHIHNWYEHGLDRVMRQNLQHDPRMGKLYDRIHAKLKASGVTLACHYTLVDVTDQDTWGLVPYMTTAPDSVKWRAVIRAMGTAPATSDPPPATAPADPPATQPSDMGSRLEALEASMQRVLGALRRPVLE